VTVSSPMSSPPPLPPALIPPPAKSWFRRVTAALGPGVITGAADDDPSGVATYSIVGAQFGHRAALDRTSDLALDGGGSDDVRSHRYGDR